MMINKLTQGIYVDGDDVDGNKITTTVIMILMKNITKLSKYGAHRFKENNVDHSRSFLHTCYK